MHPPSLTIAGTLLIPQGERSVRLADACGHVITEGDRIRAVDPVRPAPAPDLGDEACVVIPAFADCHLHLPQFDVIGVDGLELLDWLEKAVFPAEMTWADVDVAREMAARVADELISFGTTAVAAPTPPAITAPRGRRSTRSASRASRGTSARSSWISWGPPRF